MALAIQQKLDSLWVRRAPQHARDHHPAPRGTSMDSIGNACLWPLALLLVVHRLFFLAINGSITDDYTTVYTALRRFIEGVNVYNENYTFVDPHYLYNPGATLILAPLAFLEPFAAARFAFICCNAAAIIVSLGLLTRLSGFKLSSLAFPTAISIAFMTEAVQNTLVFSNINGVLLLIFTGFIICLWSERTVWAGILIGFAILIKPIFLPLLFLPAVRGQISTILAGLGVPLILNLVAWPIIPGASDYIRRTIPYLGEVRDYANASWQGFSVYFGLQPFLATGVWVLFASIVVVGVIFLLRIRLTDPLVWITTTSALILSGVFLLSSLGQMYYSMLLFPFVFTVFSRMSVLHSWGAWAGLYLALAPLDYGSIVSPQLGWWLNVYQATAGWALLIVAISTTAVRWTLMEGKQL
ncbi:MULTISPECIES: glycosyltransferase family 87 protein [unclassified Corynebacterium]|uniref:glycosyltransferase family 87 protein n=1 Tax=unclassified Corynebacterium TaxID=2624378 RepID=UPI0021676BDC|nr:MULTISPECIES: glycosyltransferase family 87 protein [unclassified Corynebacterium]MCS4489209.1 DUF2029 domain-containing protein [Corynebacterium sp. ES2775-CONJ]MCS4491022.1 DUF2029 domain-containing protein [Corynebacterium sp. ES2715-CONJ3]MCS4531097.1 DUF2029 domain-containing protein [Corynebacterium sp. ES2730-CONJ]